MYTSSRWFDLMTLPSFDPPQTDIWRSKRSIRLPQLAADTPVPSCLRGPSAARQ